MQLEQASFQEAALRLGFRQRKRAPVGVSRLLQMKVCDSGLDQVWPLAAESDRLHEQLASLLDLGLIPETSDLLLVRHQLDHRPAEAQWAVVLRGAIEVSDGTIQRFGPGDLVLAADTAGPDHVTRVVGSSPVEALSIHAREEGWHTAD